MGSLLSARIQKHRRPLCGFSATLDRLESTWKREARYRLLLLSIILVLCFLSGSWFLTFSGQLSPIEAHSNSAKSQAAGMVGLTGFVLAVMRIWPEVRRCRPRIAELQNAANQIQYLADRHALGLEVSGQEWQRAFEMASRLLRVSGRMQDEESFHPILELLARFLHPGSDKSDSQAADPSPAFIGFDAVSSQPEPENAVSVPPLRKPA